MGIKIPTKEVKQIPEGKHTGKIVKVEQRTEPYAYVDFVVTIDDVSDVELKVGYSASISVDADGKPQTELAKTLNRLGVLAPNGEENDIEKCIGLEVSYVTSNQDVEGKGTFARVAKESLKLRK